MVHFAIVGHRAVSDGRFSLDDLPGSGGRMDVLCRAVNSALLLSHSIRRDVDCYLILCGGPAPEKTILIRGAAVRHLNPDERSTAALIRKACTIRCGREFMGSTPGIFVRQGGLDRLLGEGEWAVLDEGGMDIRKAATLPDGWVLSDHLGFTEAEEELLAGLPRYSVGPLTLHGDHAITITHNERDRREAGWS
ncbi:MAG: tRNA (pseudouridine(54)-N(1))-methyltransferase TrmY [Methanoculleaceae archaeon]